MQACYPNYTEQFFINRHDADFAGRLKPGSLLRYAQQLATDQNTLLGFTPEFYAQHHFAYLLAKQTLVFARVPRIDETLTATTLPEQTRHAANKRVTLFVDEQGKEVACVDSRWVLVDTETRHIQRRSSPLFEPYWNPAVDRELPLDVPKAAQLTPLPPRQVDYLLSDMNGHLNNCSAADLACASVPLEVLRSQPIVRLSISYHREVPMGQQLELACGQAGQGWYTLGTRSSDGLPAFEAFCAPAGEENTKQ